jgi:short subunit dehydrogenase-like uncharacterized protein
MPRKYDIVVFGATGFSGRLLSEYLVKNAPRSRLALAGQHVLLTLAVLTAMKEHACSCRNTVADFRS